MSIKSAQHSAFSTLRENILEHLFISKVLKHCWVREITDLEILRSEFDGYGYDLIASRGEVVRHIQMKSGKGKPSSRISVSESLFRRPSACVLYLRIDDDLNICSYHLFAKPPGQPLGQFDHLPIPEKRPGKNGERGKRRGHRYLDPKNFNEFGSDEFDLFMKEIFEIT